MPNTKIATSVLAMSLVPQVENFLKSGTKLLIANPESTEDDGTNLLANTICYAVAKALASPSFQAALAAGVGPAAAGSLINTALQPQVIEL